MGEPGTVTIPAVEYAALLECQRQLGLLNARAMAFEQRSRSPIERDLEVSAYITGRIGLATIATIREECTALFGARRTPSRSAISRFIQRVREWRRAGSLAQPTGPI